MPEADREPIQPPGQVLRRVDWLALMPWLILFRSPGIALGKPMLFSFVATLLLSGDYSWENPELPTSINGFIREASTGLNACGEEILRCCLEGQVVDWAWLIVRGLLWSFVGLAITHHTARSFTERHPISLSASLWLGCKDALPMLGAYVLVGSTVGLLVTALAILGSLANLLDMWSMLGAMWIAVVLVLGLPIVLLAGGLLIGGEFAVSAIVIDRADTFDAVSRVYAYVYQRFGRLLFYSFVAGVIGLFTAALVEAFIALLLNTTVMIAGPVPNDFEARSFLQLWTSVLLRVADGYYGAYLFTSWTAIYLLLRQDVDGQPIDEMEAA